MVTRSGVNVNVQIARYARTQDTPEAVAWEGIPIEMGGRGGVVQLWAAHYYTGQVDEVVNQNRIWATGLSSNPAHEGQHVLAFDIEEFFTSPAIYASMVHASHSRQLTSGSMTHEFLTQVIPLYGLIRPRRQIWMQFEIKHDGSLRTGIEVYYSELEPPRVQEETVNRKYGKYRRS